MGYMEEFLERKAELPKHGSKQSIHHDKWDLEDWSSMLDEMKDLSVADDRLTSFTPTGHEAMTDLFLALYKAAPALEDTKLIRPSFLINRSVMDQAMKLKEYDEAFMYSSTDEIATGLACVAMEPDVEVLFDKLEDEKKIAEEIEQMLQSLEGMEEEQESLDDMIERALSEDDQEGAADYRDQSARLAEHMERLQQQIDQGTADLQKQLKGQAPMIADQLKKGLEKGKNEAKTMDDFSLSWGMEPGALKRVPAERRIALAKRINNEKFRRVADLFGHMRNLAMAEQSKKSKHARDMIYDLEQGDNLAFTIPSELVYLEDDILDLEFYARFYAASLLQYKLQGVEKIARGDIIFCEDGSSSMRGDREIWAKAAGLTFLQIAQMQKRGFYAVHFGGPGAFKLFDFDTKTGHVETRYGDKIERLDRIDGVIDFAETFFGGGTCFMTPLTKAMDKLREQFERDGAVRGDIVFATDGQCDVTPQFHELLKNEKERMGFRIFGIVIGNESRTEPLNTICDGRVYTIKELISGTDLKQIFSAV